MDKLSKKLNWLNAKYMVMELIGSHACRLNTLPRIHNVFHVMLLKRAANDPLPLQYQDNTQPPALIRDDHGNGEEEWLVKKILAAKKTKRGMKLLVK
jgi:hypothetical protein